MTASGLSGRTDLLPVTSMCLDAACRPPPEPRRQRCCHGPGGSLSSVFFAALRRMSLFCLGSPPPPFDKIAWHQQGFNVVVCAFMVPMAVTATTTIGIANFLGEPQFSGK